MRCWVGLLALMVMGALSGERAWAQPVGAPAPAPALQRATYMRVGLLLEAARGKKSHDALRSAVKKRLVTIRFCYEQAFRRTPGLAPRGRISLRVTPSDAGAPAVEVKNMQPYDEALAACISDVARHIAERDLRSLVRASEVTITYEAWPKQQPIESGRSIEGGAVLE